MSIFPRPTVLRSACGWDASLLPLCPRRPLREGGLCVRPAVSSWLSFQVLRPRLWIALLFLHLTLPVSTPCQLQNPSTAYVDVTTITCAWVLAVSCSPCSYPGPLGAVVIAAGGSAPEARVPSHHSSCSGLCSGPQSTR